MRVSTLSPCRILGTSTLIRALERRRLLPMWMSIMLLRHLHLAVMYGTILPHRLPRTSQFDIVEAGPRSFHVLMTVAMEQGLRRRVEGLNLHRLLGRHLQSCR